MPGSLTPLISSQLTSWRGLRRSCRMRPFARPWSKRSLSIRVKSCISHSSHASSSSLSGPMDPLPGNLLSNLLPLRHHPPRLLPLLVVGKGRNFEGSLPSSQPQVGDVLGQHWHVRYSFSSDEWTVAVLWNGYRVPLHHLPPVSLEPQELPSCSPGSIRALALWEEISKLLQKGALEPVGQPGLGFYSWLFLVEKVRGEGGLAACHRSLSSQWLRHIDEVPDGDHSFCVGIY